jgi:hypothetical protein
MRGDGGGGVAGSQPMSTAVHNSHKAGIWPEYTPYLTCEWEVDIIAELADGGKRGVGNSYSTKILLYIILKSLG